jgi:hypothetical protein
MRESYVGTDMLDRRQATAVPRANLLGGFLRTAMPPA